MKVTAVLLLTAFTFHVHTAHAQVRLPRLLRDSMILQRETPVKLWGWAAPGERVTVSFQNKRFKTKASEKGKWLLSLPAMKAGGPYSMSIDASNHIQLSQILVGDVWICSGQSNMVHQLALHQERYTREIANANDGAIRQFWVPNSVDLIHPQDDLSSGYWKAAVPGDVLQFSAVAYFFAKKIYDRYHVPIGIINSSVGGPPIEAWMSEESLKAFPEAIKTLEQNKDTAMLYQNNRRAAAQNASFAQPEDKGMTARPKCYENNFQEMGWRAIMVPGYWEDQGPKELNGIVWYRKEMFLPASVKNHASRLVLGRIVDADAVYVNGQYVGGTSYQYPQRRYTVPAGVFQEGRNVLVIKVTNYSGKGGFVPDKPYCLVVDQDSFDLRGEWHYKVGSAFSANANMLPTVQPEYQPGALYNAMIAPLVPYTVKGFVWYQGEGNIATASEYEKLLPKMITDWRAKWQQGELPFLYVQLPNFGEMQYLPSESNLAVLRQGQLKTLSVHHTAMTVNIDLGEWNDIHPDRKKEVGERLALAAFKFAYNEKNMIWSGPLFSSSTTEGNKMVIHFTQTGSGLMAKDGEPLQEFAIAGADKKFVWAEAKIEGDSITVWNDSIANPMYVRYAWADSPIQPNLYNKEGLPASPFSTEK